MTKNGQCCRQGPQLGQDTVCIEDLIMPSMESGMGGFL